MSSFQLLTITKIIKFVLVSVWDVYVGVFVVGFGQFARNTGLKTNITIDNKRSTSLLVLQIILYASIYLKTIDPECLISISNSQINYLSIKYFLNI